MESREHSPQLMQGETRKQLGFVILCHIDLYFILQVLPLGPTTLHTHSSALRVNKVGRFRSCQR